MIDQRVHFISFIFAVVLGLLIVLSIRKQDSKSTAPNWNELLINSELQFFFLFLKYLKPFF